MTKNRLQRVFGRALLLGHLLLAAIVAKAAPVSGDQLDFNRDIRPLLSSRCYECHGPDAENREANLRLDTREGAFAALESGEGHAVVAASPQDSKLLERVLSVDEDLRMPPTDAGEPLNRDEIELLRRWIAAGAPWSKHWAFIRPTRPPLPAVEDGKWPRNAIDTFVLARLEHDGLKPAPPADKEALLRRVSFDLTGLPPTLDQMDAFLADESDRAYEAAVDRLLASPHFGERLAVDWLDLARFADTNGYHIDNGREMWLWRDWVIDAFNQNKPYDQFTLEQLAGDLLPDATAAQRTASGFNRNHGTNFEAGAIDEEYRVEYVLDRLRTTSTVWLGLTLECAQCHDHKFDPFSQRDFYRLFAFFNTIADKGLDGRDGNAAPMLETASVLDSSTATVMVMQEMDEPRATYMLRRGSYADPGDRVTAGTPTSLPPMPEGAPANRLGFSQWLLDPSHPLTSRVAVNRYWQMIFGAGIVKTAEDFGVRGAAPSHPQLLDWLATDFVQNGWNIKRLLRQLVTSATYRQQSMVSPKLLGVDPENRLLARGKRVRLPAEFIRDQALAVSGLLNPKLGGPSVFPYQPAGLWQETAHVNFKGYTAQKYVESEGDDLYRRSVYTFWKRASPPPAMLAFDAPTRETCTARRQRTNTPLQALTMMNDPIFIEASRTLAEELIARWNDRATQQIEEAFRRITGRRSRSSDVDLLAELYENLLQEFEDDPDAARSFRQVGQSTVRGDLDPAQHASLAFVISLIFNLTETIVPR